MPAPAYTIRRFQPADAWAYKAMRLEALQADPGMFGNSYAMEAALADAEWLGRITNPANARFGLYAGDELAGITGIIRDENAPGAAYMTQSYIRRAHRGKGLSRMLYEARIGWAREQGISRLIIGHKAGNLASKAANQRFGFIYTHSEPRHWPDGSIEDMLYYELKL